jgi:hypothetical protein
MLKYVFLNDVLKYHVLGLNSVKNEGFANYFLQNELYVLSMKKSYHWTRFIMQKIFFGLLLSIEKESEKTLLTFGPIKGRQRGILGKLVVLRYSLA